MDTIAANEIGVKPGAEQTGAEDPQDSPLVKYWLAQIDTALKREKKYRKDAKEIVELYEGDKPKEFQFNILYSNTETMAPALFNSAPRPIVKRRFQDNDPKALLASKLGERLLAYLLDDGTQATEDFAETFESVVTSALVPGRGIPWVKYEAEFEVVPEAEAAKSEAAEGRETGDPTMDPADPAETPPEERIKSEYICVESVDWDRILFGYAKSWKKTPWLAIELYLDREDLIKLLGEEKGKLVKLTERKVDDKDRDDATGSDAEGSTGVSTACVWQIWDKSRLKVLYVSPDHPSEVLKEVDDPLKLSGFFPCPEPLMLFKRITGQTPVPLYTFYKEQAAELNRVTTRINKIIQALKVRGFYDQAVGELKDMLASEDNVLTPIQGAALATSNGGGGMDKAIWLMPIEKLILVLQQLYLQRDQVKNVIYEITGISDILRGASVASETATAQKLKADWGGLRLKRSQRSVMTCVRDTLRIMLEIAVSRFSPEQIKGMTGMPLPTGAEKAQQQQIAEQITMAGQPVPPDLQGALAIPSIDEILALLKDDLQRSYRIDIETNSTIDAEATEDKKDIAEMMNAMAQFLSGVQPMVENGTLPFEAAQAMLLAVTRRYRFGTEVEEQLLKMKPPQQGPDPKQLEQMQKQIQGEQEKLQQERSQLDLDKKTLQDEKAMASKELQLEKQFALKELALEQKFAQKEIDMHNQLAAEKLAGKEQVASTKHQLTANRLAEQKKEVGTQTEAVTALVEAVKTMLAPENLVKVVQQAMQPQQASV